MAESDSPKENLANMLTRIFADAVAEERELQELIGFLSSGVFKPRDVQEAMTNFVHHTWKITMEDGVVTEDEKKRLRAIVDALGIEQSDFIPDGWRQALAKK
jgi:uncharacterized tellurite resistance protein B-like protein